MSFLNGPVLILIIFVVPVLVLFLRWRYRTKQALVNSIGSPDLISVLIPPNSSWRYIAKAALWLISASAVIIALARPIWGLEVDSIESEGVSIYFVLDVSRSMDAEDVAPSRLERAKLDLKQVFKSLNGNALGLILFARNAFTLFPLTTDSTSLPSFINSISTESISGQGSNIAAGLRLAMNSFDQTIKSRQIVVLLSDGEALDGDTSDFLNEASLQDIIVYAIGYGGFDGAPIPLHDQIGNTINYKTDLQGNLVLSILNEQVLKTIAQVTGGSYYRADAQGNEIGSLIDSLRGIEASVLGSTVQTRGKEHFDVFAAIALIALTAEILFPMFRKRVS